jgi:methionine-rich copper-binding protein CopC
LAALALMMASAFPALAHAILVESTPAVLGSVPAGHVDVRLRFNSRIDRGRSRVTLIKPDRSSVVVPIISTGSDDVLILATELSPGAYTLRWQVLAIDGHITRGDVPFQVGAP